MRCGFLLQLGNVVVNPNASIADRVTPVDKLLGLRFAEVAEPGSQMRKLIDRNLGAGKRARRTNLGRICVNAPIRSKPRNRIDLVGLKVCRGLEAPDEVTAAQRPHLIVGDIENTLQLVT